MSEIDLFSQKVGSCLEYLKLDFLIIKEKKEFLGTIIDHCD